MRKIEDIDDDTLRNACRYLGHQFEEGIKAEVEAYQVRLKGDGPTTVDEGDAVDPNVAAPDDAPIAPEGDPAVVEPAEGESGVHPEGVQEVVADKGYHSNDVLVELAELKVRSYIAEPDRGLRNWDGRQIEKQAVYGNRRRIQGPRGKRLQRQRGERIERNFAHQFDTGGLDRLYVRGLDNVHKKLLIQAAACNLALLMRSMYGSGKPRAAHEGVIELVFAFLALMKAFDALWTRQSANPGDRARRLCRSKYSTRFLADREKRPV
jgi:hypothetical protein